MQNLSQLAGRVVDVILNPILGLIFAVGTLVFAYGIVEFMVGLSNETSDKKEAGKQHMLYGLIGMFIMASAWAIVKLIGTIVTNPVSNYGF